MLFTSQVTYSSREKEYECRRQMRVREQKKKKERGVECFVVLSNVNLLHVTSRAEGRKNQYAISSALNRTKKDIR